MAKVIKSLPALQSQGCAPSQVLPLLPKHQHSQEPSSKPRAGGAMWGPGKLSPTNAVPPSIARLSIPELEPLRRAGWG